MNHLLARRRRALSERRRVARVLHLEQLETRQLLTTTDNVYVVTNTGDSGAGSLRDAITWSNTYPNESPSTPNIIDFDIQPEDPDDPTEVPVQQVIQPLTPLPTITNPVAIDGYTEWGASTNQTTGGSEELETDVAVLMVRIDGSLTQPDPSNPDAPLNGLTVNVPNCTIDGLSITGFTSGAGIALSPGATSDTGAVGDTVWGNFIGTDTFNPATFNYIISGANPLANGEGIAISSSNNRIGSTLPPGRNVIQGNNGVGVDLFGDEGNGNEIEGDYVLDNDSDGILITSSNNYIGEPIGAGPAGAGDIISGNVGDGVHIDGAGAEGNVVVNSEIGTNVGLANAAPPIRGMTPRPNTLDGILIEDSPGNTIGGTVADAGNVIASNGDDGVGIENDLTTGATDNQVLGNSIGFNIRSGIIALLPNRDGINISSAFNTIGGTVAAARNVIIDNARNGITISGTPLDTANNFDPTQPALPYAQPSGNVIEGNFIGTQGGGDRYGNTLDGILIYGGTDNTIGGTAAGAANVISANNEGVVIAAASSGNVLQGNDIGTTSDGLNVLGNALDGVLVTDSPGTTIGGTVSGAGNVISGNKYGVRLFGGTTTESLIEGNLIGTDLTGANPVRNSIDGILIDQGASSNTIGGTVAGAGNTIAYNVDDGITVLADPDPVSGQISAENSFISNSIYSNNLLGIDLGGDGVTPNQDGGGSTGPNDFQNYPVLTAVAPDGTGTNVQGTFNSAADATYTLEFFANLVAGPAVDSQGQTLTLVSQGAMPLGTATVTTDASGNATFDVDLGVNVPSGEFVTATATSAAGDTSEFSQALPSVPVTLQFSAASYSANEGNGTVTITVNRLGGTGGKVLVTYDASGGTAVAGTDYTAVTDTLTFSPGQSTNTFSVPILDAQRVGGTETLDLTLSAPSGGATLVTPSTAVLTIVDNEQETFQFASASESALASAGSATITVNRNTGAGAATVDLTFGGTARAGTDYTPPASDTLTFSDGQTSATVTIPLLDSHLIETNPTLDLSLSDPSAGIVGASGTTVLTIQETDQPGTLQFSTATYFGYEGGGAATVTVTRSSGIDGTATVHVALGGGGTTAKAGTDYTKPASTTLTFNPGVTSQTLTIPILGSHPTSGSQTLGLTLTNPTGGATLGTRTSATLTIVETPQTSTATPSNDLNPPTIQGMSLQTNGAAITGVVLTFSEALNPSAAANVGNYGYFFLSAGRDARFGTADDGSIPIASATYNAAALQVVLTPQYPLPFNTLYQLNIDKQVNLAEGVGLTDPAGNVLASASTTFSMGARLHYFDAAGNSVTLQLTRGLMALFQAPNGNAQSLGLIDTAAGRSTLTGSVRGAVERARTPLPVITGTRGVRIRLKTPPFVIGARD